jgi:glycosyltransferase involved in cell wall biosynthesis
MRYLFIGPVLLAGIGQVTNRFCELLRSKGNEAEYIDFSAKPKSDRYDVGFAFVLPLRDQLEVVDEYMSLCDRRYYMTICETEPVNPEYGILKKYKNLLVSSEFCKQIFEKQFPEVKWSVLHLFAEGVPRAPVQTGPYVFYSIGNVVDPRKNIRGLVEAFLRCGFGDKAHLLLKATCLRPVDWKVPGVTVINGLVSNEDMEKIHEVGHCYVNCSHSEGVGMGAVEAALRKKPVIITDFGGLQEYVKTPWVVPCSKGPIGFDDFLFTKDQQWGMPSQKGLEDHMKDVFTQNIRSWDHGHTEGLMQNLRDSFDSVIC